MWKLVEGMCMQACGRGVCVCELVEGVCVCVDSVTWLGAQRCGARTDCEVRSSLDSRGQMLQPGFAPPLVPFISSGPFPVAPAAWPAGWLAVEGFQEGLS